MTDERLVLKGCSAGRAVPCSMSCWLRTTECLIARAGWQGDGGRALFSRWTGLIEALTKVELDPPRCLIWTSHRPISDAGSVRPPVQYGTWFLVPRLFPDSALSSTTTSPATSRTRSTLCPRYRVRPTPLPRCQYFRRPQASYSGLRSPQLHGLIKPSGDAAPPSIC